MSESSFEWDAPWLVDVPETWITLTANSEGALLEVADCDTSPTVGLPLDATQCRNLAQALLEAAEAIEGKGKP